MTAPLIFFAQIHLVGLEMMRDAFSAPCLGRKVTQKSIFGVKYLRNPTTRGACPHHEGRPKELLSFIAIFYTPGGEVPFVVGSVKHFTPNMDIWSQVDPPKRENPPQAISNQD